MKIFYKGKDGGQYSTVWGYWLVEIKSLFSIVLLKFEDGSREAYHEHAFNCVNWVLKGELKEQFFPLFIKPNRKHIPRIRPFMVKRKDFHKVSSKGTTWVLSFRGPWTNTWKEYDEKTNKVYTLTNGRRIVE
jgi:hypothetical protein